jgi:20S proteasome alpha/beta subunit
MHDRSSIVKRNPYPLKHLVYSPRRRMEHAKMTIGMGFRCSDGVVLACDSLVTLSGVYKEHQHKLVFLEKDGAVIASCYAGTPNLASSFYHRLEQRMQTSEPTSAQGIMDAISELAQDFKKKHPKDMPYEQFLFAISLAGQKPKLARLENGIVDEPTTPCIGIGNSALVKYLISKLTWYPAMIESASYLVVLAAYVVAQAKEFIDGCGGDTSAVIITEDAGIRAFMGLPIEDLESRFEYFDDDMRKQFKKLVDDFSKNA